MLRGQQHRVTNLEGDCAAVLIGVVRLSFLRLFDVLSSTCEVCSESLDALRGCRVVRRTQARDGLIEIDAEVPEADLAKLKAGQKAVVTLPDGATVTGTVRLIAPEVDQTTKLGHARILLPVRTDLRPGGYAYARLPGVKTTSLVAPDRAVSFDAEGAAVYVVDPSNHVHRVAVRTGERAGGLVELLQGPPAGSLVLVTGASFVLDGDKVTPVEGTS